MSNYDEIQVDLSEMDAPAAVAPAQQPQEAPQAVESVPAEPEAQEAPAAPQAADTAVLDDGIDDKTLAEHGLTRSDFNDIRDLALKRLSQSDRIALQRLFHDTDITVWQIATAVILSSSRPDYERHLQNLDAQLKAAQSVVDHATDASDKNAETIKAAMDRLEKNFKTFAESEREFFEEFITGATSNIEASTKKLHMKIVTHYRDSLVTDVLKLVREKSENQADKAMTKAMVFVAIGTAFGAMASGLLGMMIGRMMG